jgi:uncharacterized damage-inducible protein DinB
MTPDEAHFFVQTIVEDAGRESATTSKVLAAVPADKCEYRPAPDSMTALDLAWHTAASEVYFLNGIADGEFGPGGKRPETVQTGADVVAWYEANRPAAADRVKAMTPEQCAKVISFHGIFILPAFAYMNFMVKHSIHHRGQLSCYLRPMGAKVPAIYGGSFDEPVRI